MIIKFVTSFALFYIAAMIAIYFAQSLFIYLPDMPTRNLEAVPTDINLQYDNVYLTTKDQIQNTCMVCSNKKCKKNNIVHAR